MKLAPRRGLAGVHAVVAGVVVYGCVLGGSPDDSLLRSGSSATEPGDAEIVDAGESFTPPPPPAWDPDAPAAPPGAHDKFASAKTCAPCHTTIYQQWSTSMHARAMTSPLFIAQNNQVVAGPLAKERTPDPQRFCINCHSPTAANVTTGSILPLEAASNADEGVSCTGCHQFNGEPTSGGGGLSTSYQAGLVAGTTYFGPLGDAVPTTHGSASGVAFQQRNLTCANCHNVNLDLDHDRNIVKGRDLVLQQTFDEYSRYRIAGGDKSCTDCHMPVIPGLTRIADGTDVAAPPRVVHDHSFVGVDYSLDDPNQQLAAREALLRSAAVVRIEPTTISRASGLSFAVSIENTTAGHNLPTGFAFSRQLWLEIKVTSGGATVFQSGVLANPTDDLCDGSTLNEIDNPVKPFLQGCPGGTVDTHLVSLQTKLVDKIAVQRDASGTLVRDRDGEPVLVLAENGHESVLQSLTGGAVARTRPVDGTALGPLRPFEKKSFVYATAVATPGPLTISVRMLFRTVPPYVVRALAQGQPAAELPRLAPLVGNVRTVVMGTDSLVAN